MLKGYLLSKGVAISERHLRSAVPLIAPVQHRQRQLGQVDRTNPHVYHASYYGEKLHIDQNEKLCMYGVTYVLARDGYSGRITAGAIMPQKNNIAIFDEVYLPTVMENGLWDQVRVDHGREFYLVLFIQEKLRVLRGNLSVAPYRQTTSRANHVIERIWVELNRRVSYPIKRAISAMVIRNAIDLDSEVVKFCVSVILMSLCKIGMDRFISAWNCHHLPSRGIPNLLQSHRNGTTAIHPHEVPSTQQATDDYRQQGGTLSDPKTFGSDPLAANALLCNQRDEVFSERIGTTFSEIFNQVLIGNTVPFEQAILNYILITEELSG